MRTRAGLDLHGYRTKNMLYEDSPFACFAIYTDMEYGDRIKEYFKNHNHAINISSGSGELEIKMTRVGGMYDK